MNMKDTAKVVKLKGVVSTYSGNGRKLGYPTANIKAQTKLADGVYFGFAKLCKFVDRPALIFIGTPTTVGDRDRRVEAHLLDIPDADYYGAELELNILQFHRPNQTFGTVDELIKHMKQDEKAGRQWFESRGLA